MGTVDGRGHDWQQTDAICDAHGPRANDSERCQGSFSPISTDWSRLQVAQTPRFRDLAIFAVTLIALPLHMREVTMIMHATYLIGQHI